MLNLSLTNTARIMEKSTCFRVPLLGPGQTFLVMGGKNERGPGQAFLVMGEKNETLLLDFAHSFL